MEQLTRFSKGSIREIFALCFPILLALLSQCIMSFCDRYFLSHYSLEAFKGACLGGYLALFFQISCIRLTAINQTLISRAVGEKIFHRIAPYTWQMIWAALLTTLVVVPVGLIANHYYFVDTPAEKLGSEYFLILLSGNFLFALGGAFTGFQSGIGETKVLTRTALIANICNALLNYLLIYGVKGWIPPLGIVGAGVGTVISQGLCCCLLFHSFVKHKKGKAFQVEKWRFSAASFFELLRLGAPSAGAGALNLFYWALAVKIVAHIGGDFLLVLSYGGMLWIPLSAIVQALRQGMVSIISFFLGKNLLPFVFKSLRSAFVLHTLLFLFLGIPLLIFSAPLAARIVPEEVGSTSFQFLQRSSFWVWIYFFLCGISSVVEGLIVALKKNRFLMLLVGLTGPISTILPYYLAFHIFYWSPDKVWMANWPSCLAVIAGVSAKVFVELNKKEIPIQLEGTSHQ